MKVKLKKQNELLNVAKDGITLETIKDGYFHYKMRLNFNFNKILAEKSFAVTLLGREKAYEKVEPKIFPNFNPDLIVKELQTQRPSAIDLARSTKIEAFFSKELDLTAFFPKTAIGKIQNAFDKSAVLKKRTLKPVAVGDLQSKNVSAPILENNLSRNIVTSTRTANNAVLKSDMNKVLFDTKRDPADFSSPTFTVGTANSSFNGTIPKTPKKLMTISQGLNDREKNSIIGSLLNDRTADALRSLPPDAILMMPVEEETYFLTATFDILIPVGDLNTDNFYFTLLHKTKQNVVQGIYNFFVPHLKNVENLNIPTEAPLIEVLPRVNNNFVDIALKQVDPTATQIFLYRKQVKKDAPSSEESFVEIGRYSVQGAEYVRVLDVLPGLSPTIYRAVPVGINGVMGAEFSSAFVDVENSFSLSNKKRQQRPSSVSINTENFSNGVKVEVRSLPAGPISWCVLRKNLSNKETKYSIISNIFQITDESSAPLIFEDTTVNLDKIYDYKIRMIYKDGFEVDSTTTSTIGFKPISSNVVNTKILSPTVVTVGNEYDTTFSITSEIIPGQIDLVKNALASQGLTEYADAIQADRSQLQKLFSYKVERFNMVTGELEDFGVIREPSFSDLKYQKNSLVKPIEAGARYQYKVITYLRATDSLLSSIRTTVSGSRGYTYQPFKWKHPLALNQGTLSTPESRKRNFAESDFTFGDVVDITTTTVSLADNIPIVEQAVASKISNSKVLISWNVKGTLKKIDHFIVILEVLGIRTVVGKSHALGNTNHFRFLDNLTNNEKGGLTYIIIPVYQDQGRGAEVKTNTVVVE